MRLPLFIGIRYAGLGGSGGLPASGTGRYLKFVSSVSLLGMVLGVIALIVVVSVMNGFDRELKRRILGVVPHMVVEGVLDPEYWQNDRRILAAGPFLSRSGLLLDGKATQFVLIQGIDAMREGDMSILPGHMTEGSMDELASDEQGMVMGRPLAWRLGYVVGDVVTVVIPEPSGDGRRVQPHVLRLRLTGTFEVDSELDYRLLLVNVTNLQRAVGKSSPDTRLRLANLFDVSPVLLSLEGMGQKVVFTWTGRYGDFFETVKMEKIMMFILLSLVVTIAAFNIISSLSMMVRDKQGDIAVLRTFGLSPGNVMRVFVVQGAVIGLAGTLIGAVFGLVLAHNITDIVHFLEQWSGRKVLAGTYFDSVPSDVRYGDVLMVMVVTFTISLTAAIYPSWRAARLRPADVLRYE